MIVGCMSSFHRMSSKRLEPRKASTAWISPRGRAVKLHLQAAQGGAYWSRQKKFRPRRYMQWWHEDWVMAPWDAVNRLLCAASLRMRCSLDPFTKFCLGSCWWSKSKPTTWILAPGRLPRGSARAPSTLRPACWHASGAAAVLEYSLRLPFLRRKTILSGHIRVCPKKLNAGSGFRQFEVFRYVSD